MLKIRDKSGAIVHYAIEDSVYDTVSLADNSHYSVSLCSPCLPDGFLEIFVDNKLYKRKEYVSGKTIVSYFATGTNSNVVIKFSTKSSECLLSV